MALNTPSGKWIPVDIGTPRRRRRRKYKEVAKMPYPNEHSYRVENPGKFAADSFRSKSLKVGVRIIMGKLKEGDGSMVIQAYRFDSGKFSADEAKKWLKDHEVSGGKFEAATNKRSDDAGPGAGGSYDMKLPRPKKGETKNDYVTRSVEYLVAEHDMSEEDATKMAKEHWKEVQSTMQGSTKKYEIEKSIPRDISLVDLSCAVRDALALLVPDDYQNGKWTCVEDIYLDGTCIITFHSKEEGTHSFRYDFTFVDDKVELSNPTEVERDWVEAEETQKSEGEGLGKAIEIFKKDEDQRLVYGIVLEPDVEDAQGDTISADEIAKAAHNFMIGYRSQAVKMGEMHKREARKVHVVESFLASEDLSINKKAIKKGSWLVVSKVKDDEIWEKVKSGEYGGYSIGGRGKRDPIKD